MLKQIISFFLIIAVSAAVVFFMPEAQKVIQALVSAHDWVSGILTNVFNDSHTGNIARELTALIVIPLLAGLIPAIIFFLLRKYWLPSFMEIIWVVWLLQTGAMLMVYVYPAQAENTKPAAEPTPAFQTAPKQSETPAQKTDEAKPDANEPAPTDQPE
ncbi:MAG TPA: hypothetical protein VL360_01585 [Gammaproteobacteria bacterium]|jgi:hypothetical protein|nr:hypothetical protein [Gammaproteobacteria bacterium]